MNEGGSTVDLDRVGAEWPTELISVPSRASSLILRTIPAGTYTVIAKKPGFHEFVRTIDLAEGKRRRVNIVLRPKMAILSVTSNVPDASFSIVPLGTFNRPIKKQFVVPGIYHVSVSRRGYESRTVAVNLKGAGQEQNLNVVLQPLRLDAVLDQAAGQIGQRRFADAEASINDVLLLNASHARANLLRGMIELRKGNSAAVSFLLKALERGETLRLKMDLTEANGSKTSSINFEIDREDIGIESRERFDLNFRIKRTALSGLDWSGRPAFIAVRGKADFHGRPIEPNFRLSSTVGGNSEPLSDMEMQILFKLLTAWRSLPEARAAFNRS